MKEFIVNQQLRYMRIPFKEHGRSFDGCDCGGLVWLVYKTELDIELPDWREYYQNTQIESFNDLSNTTSTMLANLAIELPRNSPLKPFDVVSLKIAGMPVHVGIMTTPYTFIHISENCISVRQERIDCIAWRRRIDGIFRHKDLWHE